MSFHQIKSTVYRCGIQVVRFVNFTVGLLFLPTPWRKWLFNTALRPLKVLNLAVLAGWIMVLLDGGFGSLPSYAGFSKVPVPWAVAILAAVALLLLWSVYRAGSLRAQVVGGAGLMLCGLVWLAVSISFWTGFPPLHTGMIIYPTLSLLSVLAGDHMRDAARMERAKRQEYAEKEGA